MRVAFCGLGRMGSLMAGHVLAAGHEVAVWNRTPGKAGDLPARGAREAASPADAVAGAAAVVLVLHGPDSVAEVLSGPGGVLGGLSPDALVVDTTTIGPTDARRFAAEVAAAGGRYLDAPLFGSVAPAAAGSLASFVGGDEAAAAEARPLLETWCDPAALTYAGPVGSGAAVKVVRNLGHAVVVAGLGEGLRLAADLGVPRDTALAGFAAGPFSWTLAQRQAQIAGRDFADPAFTLELMAKDAGLAVAEARRPLPVVAAALAEARAAIADGRGGEDYAALAAWIEDAG
jgi:3-hydroxyisobutyrate dehydrogenase